MREMKIAKYTVLIFLALGFFNSCMMGPYFQKPEMDIPDSYLGEADSSRFY
jgi:hypothetical protein